MAIEQTYICDRCGRSSRNPHEWSLAELRPRLSAEVPATLDLCPECTAKIDAMLFPPPGRLIEESDEDREKTAFEASPRWQDYAREHGGFPR